MDSQNTNYGETRKKLKSEAPEIQDKKPKQALLNLFSKKILEASMLIQILVPCVTQLTQEISNDQVSSDISFEDLHSDQIEDLQTSNKSQTDKKKRQSPTQNQSDQNFINHSQYKLIRKASRNSMSQNYKGAITRGFASHFLSAIENKEDKWTKEFQNSLEKNRQPYEELCKLELQDLENLVIGYIKQKIYGKVAYKTKNRKSADRSKVSSNEDIQRIFYPVKDEREKMKFVKVVAREMLWSFFEEERFEEWIKTGSAMEAGKIFLRKNRKEILNVFQNPLIYKPKFDKKDELYVNLKVDDQLDI